MAEQSLFPVFEMPEFMEAHEPDEERYKCSVYWDMEKGDFVRDGASRLVESSGRDAYMQWCYKMAQTERYAHLAYPDYIGTELAGIAEESDNQAVESMVERTITEALLVNARTEYVRDFSFEWMGDSLRCEFTVKGRDWEEFPLQLTIRPEEEVMEDDS